MKISRSALWSAWVTLGLVACGGGGSDAGQSLFSGTTSSSSSSSTSSTDNVASTSSGTVVLSLSSNTISASTPGTVTALVKKADGAVLANALVNFSVDNGTATVSPARVMTDAQGMASATLQPQPGAIGADYVTAKADLSSSATLTTRSAFTVSSANVTLTAGAAAPASISAYGASVVSVDVSGASSASPVTVNFSSTCSTAGKAALSPAAVTVTGTSASTTYQDKGCAATDRISATITGTSQQKQMDLVVAAPVAQSLEFVAATPEKICLAGSGCEVSSKVSFRLQDQYKNPISNRTVSFSLDKSVATLGAEALSTDANGVVTVSVSAKTVPSPIRVNASVVLDDGTKLATVSNLLTISSGLPTSRAVSFSAARYSMNNNLDGDTAAIRVQLNDRFANPVPDGPAVSFVAEGASVIPANCVTAGGVCSVNFVVSNYRPNSGRVSVVAYAKGEESFTDTNNDNLYTQGEVFDDTGSVYIDKNKDGNMAATGEYLIGNAANSVWDSNAYVWAAQTFVLSDTANAPRVYKANSSGSCAGISNSDLISSTNPVNLSLTAVSSCRRTQAICIRDANTNADIYGGNPIASGATLSLVTKAKGGAVKIDNSPTPSTATTTTLHRITADLDDCSQALTASGALELTIRMPNGNSFTYDIGKVQ